MKKTFEHFRILPVPSLGVSLPFRQPFYLFKKGMFSTTIYYNALTIHTCWGDIATRGKNQPSGHP